MTNEEKLAVKWDSLTIKDNFIFGKVMEVNSDWCRRLIEHILDIKIESISYPEREKTIEARLDSKGIRLDVYVKDDKWRLSYMTYELALLEREEQGREESTIEHLRSVINSLKVPVERAMEILNVPKDEQSYYAFKLKESVK